MENYKELLIELYKKHAPEKLDQIDFYLDRYKGKEKQFYITQKAKYANTRSVTDSKKILEKAMERIAQQKRDSAKKNLRKESPQITPGSEERRSTEIGNPETNIKTSGEKPKIIKKEVESTKTTKVEEVKKEINEVIEAPIIEKHEQKVVVKEPLIDESKKINLEKEKRLRKEQLRKEALEIKKQAEQKKQTSENASLRDAEEKTKSPTAEELINKTRKEKKEQEMAELEKSKARLQASKEREKKRKKVNLVVWYFGAAAITILLIAIFIYFNYFRTTPTHSKGEVNIQKVEVESKAVNTSVKEDETAAIEPQTEKVTTNTDKKSVKKDDVKPVKKAQVVKKKPKAAPQKESVHPTAERLYANDIPSNSIFVSCFAVTKEAYAQKKVAALKSANLEAHYYWIPDIDSRGNTFFKIVVGPFSSINEANPSLTKVQEHFNFDAYIIRIH
jgi:cytoskeletal protein RodZ